MLVASGWLPLAAVAVDRDRLEPELPAVGVCALDVLDGCLVGHVHRLGDRAADERLHRGHHPEVALPRDRALAVLRRERAVEDRDVLIAQRRRAFDGVVGVDERDDVADRGLAIAEPAQCGRHGAVDHLQHPAADELLVLDERDIRLDAGGVAVEHEADRPGGREHRRLRVAIAMARAELVGFVPCMPRCTDQVGLDVVGGDVVRGLAMLADHAQHRLAVERVAAERTDLARDARRLRVRLAGEDRGEAGGQVATLRGVVRNAASHEQRTEVRVAEPERAELLAVPGDLLGRVRGVADQDLLRRDRDVDRVLVGLDVDRAVVVEEAGEVDRRQVAAGVVEEHELAAGVAGVDATGDGDWCASR